MFDLMNINAYKLIKISLKMKERNTIYFFDSGILNYEDIRNNVINNREILCSKGYSCHWRGDLDLDGDEFALFDNNFYQTQKGIRTLFAREDNLYEIRIWVPNSEGKIFGSGVVEDSDFKDLTGIELKVTHVVKL